MPGTNAQAYYKYSEITDIKSFITLGSGIKNWQLIYPYWSIKGAFVLDMNGM
jgi:hypothetical protein